MDIQKALAHVFGETSLSSNERVVLYHVLTNSNSLYRCPLTPTDLERLTGLSHTSCYAAQKRLIDKNMLIRHKEPHYYIGWPFINLYNLEGGGGRLWTNPQQVRLMLAMTDEKITALTSITQDFEDRKRAAQQGHGVFNRTEEYMQSLHNLDSLRDLRELLDQYLRRNESSPESLTQEKPSRRKTKKA